MIDEQSLPDLDQIHVEGVLEFENVPLPSSRRRRATGSNLYYNIKLTANHIIINGGRLIIGWPDNPFLGKAEIILRGTHASPDFILMGAPNVGGKAIGVFGGLDLHGIPRTYTKSVLATAVAPGDTTLIVADAVDWVIDDEIVVASTSYNGTQSEKRTIISITGTTIVVDTAFEFQHSGM